jgi:cytochrome c-type biogenesis protein CcmH
MKHSYVFISGSWLLVSRFLSFVSRLSYFCFLLFALCLLPFIYAPVSGFAVTTQEVEEALTCQCGCGLTVHSCNHLQCGFAVPAKKTIADLVAQGKSKEEITRFFVSTYGEKVLSAPTTKGFNLAAWITPFAVVLAGGIGIGIVSLRWARRRSQEEEPAQPVITTRDHYRERLKKELESFEG